MIEVFINGRKVFTRSRNHKPWLPTLRRYRLQVAPAPAKCPAKGHGLCAPSGAGPPWALARGHPLPCFATCLFHHFLEGNQVVLSEPSFNVSASVWLLCHPA